MNQISTKKITVGFKCDPSLKFQLTQESKALGLTVSAYLEMLVLQRANLDDKQNIEMIEILKTRLSFYENSELKHLFEKYKGQPYKVLDVNGNKQTRYIGSLQETFEIILSIFKNKLQ
ncbi:hypothetical protein SAMN06298216_3620 [Spirosomataceae bacterium TFI 002]|nr:hypothetical protein SAMN06298216_3620 [Spirosomataceae bacterium TFI 002]